MLPKYTFLCRTFGSRQASFLALKHSARKFLSSSFQSEEVALMEGKHFMGFLVNTVSRVEDSANGLHRAQNSSEDRRAL